MQNLENLSLYCKIFRRKGETAEEMDEREGFWWDLEADDVGIEGVEEAEEGAVLGHALPQPVHIVCDDLHRAPSFDSFTCFPFVTLRAKRNAGKMLVLRPERKNEAQRRGEGVGRDEGSIGGKRYPGRMRLG